MQIWGILGNSPERKSRTVKNFLKIKTKGRRFLFFWVNMYQLSYTNMFHLVICLSPLKQAPVGFSVDGRVWNNRAPWYRRSWAQTGGQAQFLNA